MDTLHNSILNALTKEQRRQIQAELKNAANELKVDVEIVFYMRIPSSYSKIRKTRLEGTPHTKKPDLDNLIKNLLDRGTGILWTDDSRLSSIVAKKKWSEKPRIDLAIEFGRLTNL